MTDVKQTYGIKTPLRVFLIIVSAASFLYPVYELLTQAGYILQRLTTLAGILYIPNILTLAGYFIFCVSSLILTVYFCSGKHKTSDRGLFGAMTLVMCIGCLVRLASVVTPILYDKILGIRETDALLPDGYMSIFKYALLAAVFAFASSLYKRNKDSAKSYTFCAVSIITVVALAFIAAVLVGYLFIYFSVGESFIAALIYTVYILSDNLIYIVFACCFFIEARGIKTATVTDTEAEGI